MRWTLELLQTKRISSLPHNITVPLASFFLLLAFVLCLNPLKAHAEPIAYFHDDYGTIKKIYLCSGLLSNVGSAGVNLTDIAMSPDGDLYGIGYMGDFYSIDKETGAATLLSEDLTIYSYGLGFGANGKLYTSSRGYLFSIDTTTGQETLIGSLAVSNTDFAHDIVALNGNLFFTNSYGLWVVEDYVQYDTPPPIGFYYNIAKRVNWTTLNLDDIRGLAVSADGILWGFSGNWFNKDIYQIDFDISKGTVSKTLVHHFSSSDYSFSSAAGATIVESAPAPLSNTFTWAPKDIVPDSYYTDEMANWAQLSLPWTNDVLEANLSFGFRMNYRAHDAFDLPIYRSLHISHYGRLDGDVIFEHELDTLNIQLIELGVPAAGVIETQNLNQAVVYEMGKTGEIPTLNLMPVLCREEDPPKLSIGQVENSVAKFHMYDGIIDGVHNSGFAAGIEVGREGWGEFIQKDGDIQVGDFSLASTSTSEGSYTLEGGVLNTHFLSVGGYGFGTAYLIGGEVNIGQIRDDVQGSINVGNSPGGTGILNLSGNTSINPNMEIDAAGSMEIGRSRHADGTFAFGKVWDSNTGPINLYHLVIGGNGQGAYNKNGSGILRSGEIILGLQAGGYAQFIQSSGVVQIESVPDPDPANIVKAGLQGRLRIGVNGAYGTYNLQDGILKLAELDLVNGVFHIENGLVLLQQPDFLSAYQAILSVLPDGVFQQDGGTVTGELIHNRGVMTMTGGSLNGDYLSNEGGQIDIQSGTISIAGDYYQQDPTALTNVNGKLLANGTITISDGLLTGTGEIDGNLYITSGAQMNPGNSTGTILVNGPFSLTEGADLILEVGSADIDRLVVSGAYSLSGSVTFHMIEGVDFITLENYYLKDFFLQGATVGSAVGVTNLDVFSGLSFTVTDGVSSHQVFILSDGQLSLSEPILIDTDNDGITDDVEDTNMNGNVDPGETDPNNPDTDCDGLFDGFEDANHDGTLDLGESDPLNPNDPYQLINYYVVNPQLSALPSSADRVVFFDTSPSVCYEMVNCVKEDRICSDTWDFGGDGGIVGGNGDDIVAYQYNTSGDYTVSLTMTEQDSDTTATNNFTVTAEIVQTPLPSIDFATTVNTAAVSLSITDLDPNDSDVASVIVFWGDRYRTEETVSLPATIDHTYTRTGSEYHIRVKAIFADGGVFNYTFMADENLTVSIP